MSRRLSLPLAFAIVIASTISILSPTSMFAGEVEKASLKITFKLQGKVKPPKPLAPKGQFCGNMKGLVDESLVVNKENKGIRDIFVHVYVGRRGPKLPAVDMKPKTIVLDNKNCRFEPHAIFLRTVDTLKVTNSDNVGHNVNIPFFKNDPINVNVPQGPKGVEFQMKLTEPSVVPTVCGSHTWMMARVLVQDHPYAAISDKDGVCVIEGLPAGQKITFRANHETGKFSKITINGKADSWKLNRFDLTLKPGENDMGVVELPW